MGKCLFTSQIVESDSFLKMPLSTQALYFHYCLNADCDGFVKNPISILKMVGASEKDLETLEECKFIIRFDAGVLVIKHWHIHNAFRKDRYKETEYTEQRKLLFIKANDAYTLDASQGIPYKDFIDAKRLPSGCQTVAPSKDKISEDNKEKNIKEKKTCQPKGNQTKTNNSGYMKQKYDFKALNESIANS